MTILNFAVILSRAYNSFNTSSLHTIYLARVISHNILISYIILLTIDIGPPLNFSLSACFSASSGTRFDIEKCYHRTRGCSFFPKVPIHVCEDYCGGSFGYYNLSAVFGALTAWVIPLFALLANMHFADSTLEGLEWCRTPKVLNQRWLTPLWSMTKSHLPIHFVCAVQLANPVSTIWSLAVKLDLGQQLWNYCNEQRLPKLGEGRRNFAHLCYCLDDFGYEEFENRVDRLIQFLNNPRTSTNVYEYVKKTSGALAFARARNTRHTIFAILVYIGMAVSTLLAFAMSFTISYSTPTKGIGGRGLAEILYLIVWIVNFFISLWMNHKINDDDNGRKRLFVLIWQKDAIISLLVLLFFFLPFIGKPYSREICSSILFAHLHFQVGTIPANRGQLGSAFMTKPM